MEATHDNYALLIGVNDYSAYDASLGNAKGTSDLGGSVNDVRAWWRLCQKLGYKPENIRVLTSPAVSARELEGAHTGPATADAIREGVAWLAEKLGADREAGGLLTYSGHGDQTQRGLVLCPTNTVARGDELENDVALLELQATIARRDAARNLTVVLDCCHSGGGTAGQRAELTLRHRSAAVDLAVGLPSIGDRMFFAAELGQSAYQAELGGAVHGAFTWAFMTTQEQWTIIGTGSNREITISYAEMRSRTQALLAALSFEQTPALRCPPGVQGLPLFHKGLVAEPGETSADPDGARKLTQCDPGSKDYRVYIVYQWNPSISLYSVVGYMVVANVSSPSGAYLAGREYWCMSQNLVSSQNIAFSWTDYTWAGTPTPPIGGTPLSFTMTQNAVWSATTPPTQTAGNLFCNNGQGNVSLVWNMSQSGSYWSGTVTWYSPTGQNTVFGGLPTAIAYLPANTVPQSTWFSATLRAT